MVGIYVKNSSYELLVKVHKIYEMNRLHIIATLSKKSFLQGQVICTDVATVTSLIVLIIW